MCETLIGGLKKIVKERKSVLLRLDPEPFGRIDLQENVLLASGLRKIPERYSQWNRTLYTTRVILNLNEEELYKRMSRTLRKHIKRAIKNGITISNESEEGDAEKFALLMKGLESKRNSILHSSEYYRKIYNNLVIEGPGILFKAKLGDEVISCLIVVVLKDKAWAVFIANDYAYRKMMPNKLLQWEAIRFAKSQGCRFFDLGATQGTPDFDAVNDPLDYLKSAYKPEIIHYPGYYDIPNAFYNVFRSAESKIMPKLMKEYVIIHRILKKPQQQSIKKGFGL